MAIKEEGAFDRPPGEPVLVSKGIARQKWSEYFTASQTSDGIV